MGNHHEPLSYLGPVDWSDVALDDLKPFLDGVFSAAQTVVESIPSPSNLNEISRATETPALPRSQSESSETSTTLATSSNARHQSPAAVEQSRKLREEWKEVKVNSRENPLDIKVYKLAAKDGKGTWFARRSVHDGLSYDQWEKGLAEELIETLKIQGQPGGGSIRGIGADRLVEQVDAPGSGQAKVFHLSAQFPGPTSPRDFVTLLLSSGAPKSVPGDPRVIRQFMIVSKPCIHPECEPQQGTIRGQYESIELIREVLPEKPASERSSSSTDISGKSKSSDNLSTTTLDSPPSTSKAQEPPTTIEWLMITRSDPGGSVPRFMIEKGTPPGIVNDAGKFIKWVTSRSASQEVRESTEGGDVRPGEGGVQDKPRTESRDPPPYVEALPSGSNETSLSRYSEEDVASSNGGLWGMVTGAFWGASSVVSAGLRMPFGTSSLGQDEDEEDQPGTPSLEIGDEEDSGSDTSSIRTFTSALDRSMTQEEDASADVQQSNSDDKSSGKSSQLKELKKLEERRRKLDEKAARMAERWESKRQEDKEKDAAALTRAQEKHAKEVAKHEAKYNRELRRIKEKKEQEERKAEQRRKKAAEREAKANAAMELEKMRAERDYALKQVELLKAQVGELQSQNTMLTAKMGKLNGLDTSDSASVSSKNTQGGKSPKL